MCIFPSDNFPKFGLGPLRRRMLKWETEHCDWIGLWGLAVRSGWARVIGLWLDQAGDRAQLLEQDGDRVLHIGQAGDRVLQIGQAGNRVLQIGQAGDRVVQIGQVGDRVLQIGQAGYVASGKIAQLGKYPWVSCCYSLHYIKLLLIKK